MDSEKEEVMYRRYNQRKGESSKTQRSPAVTLNQSKVEIMLLEDKLEELKAHKKMLEKRIKFRTKLSQHLSFHKYSSGIFVLDLVEDEYVFEFKPMVINKLTKSYCMLIKDLEDGLFVVLKYNMPTFLDVRGLLRKPEFQNGYMKYLRYIHSCLIAYNDRKHQVMQAESSLKNKGIKIANTMDYKMLEITFNLEDKRNNKFSVVLILKYEDIEVRPRTLSVECEDISKETTEVISAEMKDLKTYSLEVGLRLALLKNESSTESADNVNSETEMESATTVEYPQTNFRHLEVGLGVYKRVRGKDRSVQQHSAESGLEISEEEVQNKQKARRGRGRGRGSRGHGRGKHVPFIKQERVEPVNRERSVSRRGRGHSDKRGSNKGKTFDISKYFEQSNPF